MPPSAPERFDADPSAYAEYLRTPLGRLRAELSWLHLRPHLPRPEGATPRALDVGAGAGEMALRLAAMGWSVTLVDGSQRMLDHAAELAEARGLGGRVECRRLDLDAGGLADALERGTYDLVVCHHVLEYVASPDALLQEARAMLRAGGRVSLVVRSRAGEVMKRLLGGADADAAIRLLAAPRVREELYGLEVRPFDLGELRRLVGDAGLAVVAERGVRVADHLTATLAREDDAFERILQLELRLGESPELSAVARYLQLIAARGDVPATPRAE